MKRSLVLILVLCISFSGFTQAQKKKETRPLGLWKMVDAYSGGEQVSDEFKNRTMYFTPENKFISMMKLGDQELIFNQGKYQMFNDTTMVTFHMDAQGNLYDIANTYYIKVDGDKMYFWGYYLSGTKPAGYLTKFLEEWWVKVEEKK